VSRVGTISYWILRQPRGRILNLGSKNTSWGTVRADIDRSSRPIVVGSALSLPFMDAAFDGCIFADVIEHLPRGSEQAALAEIHRVVKTDGWFFLTTPNDRLWFKLLDPAFWLTGHRHYTRAVLLRMLAESGFRVNEIGTFGEPLRETIEILSLYSVRRACPRVSRILLGDPDTGIDRVRPDERGYTHIIVSTAV
jgi:SAM-dependent methyltransferase